MNEAEVVESERYSIFREHPTLVLSVGAAYITILGYLSSSKLLNYFGVRATDYFNLEDFILSGIRDANLFFFLAIGLFFSFLPYLYYVRRFNQQKAELKNIQDELVKVKDIESLSEEEAREYVTKANGAKVMYAEWGRLYRKTKYYQIVGVVGVLIASFMSARNTSNSRYLDIINFEP
jgi:hypothetical protein